MSSNFLISKYEKLEKNILEIKNNIKSKLKKMNLPDLNWKKPFESLLPAKEEGKEKIEDSKPRQTLFEFPEKEESEEDLEKKRKREVIFELALFLVLGILIGITVKTEAVKRITIGFSDYKITTGKNDYNIEDMKKKLEEQAMAAQTMEQAQQEQTSGQTNNNQTQPQK
jgi:hypothetical protein